MWAKYRKIQKGILSGGGLDYKGKRGVLRDCGGRHRTLRQTQGKQNAQGAFELIIYYCLLIIVDCFGCIEIESCLVGFEQNAQGGRTEPPNF